jgi:hypothetical protein
MIMAFEEGVHGRQAGMATYEAFNRLKKKLLVL